jgi:hypothetical protein
VRKAMNGRGRALLSACYVGEEDHLSSDITSVDGGAQRVTPRSLAADKRSRTVLAIPGKVNTVKLVRK